MKLTKAQNEVVKWLQNGHVIEYFSGFGYVKAGAAITCANGIGSKKIPLPTFRVLRDKNVLTRISKEGFHTMYKLNPLFK